MSACPGTPLGLVGPSAEDTPEAIQLLSAKAEVAWRHPGVAAVATSSVPGLEGDLELCGTEHLDSNLRVRQRLLEVEDFVSTFS